MLKCPKCGAEYNDNTWFCIKCGSMIDQVKDHIGDAEEAPAEEKEPENMVNKETLEAVATEEASEASAQDKASETEEAEHAEPQEKNDESEYNDADHKEANEEPEDEGMQFTDFRDTGTNFDKSDLGSENKTETELEPDTESIPTGDDAEKEAENAGVGEDNSDQPDTDDASEGTSEPVDAAAEDTSEPVNAEPAQGYQHLDQQVDEQQYQNYQQYDDNPYDSGSVGWGILGFLFPIVGLILFLVWHDNKPKSAKSAGIGALISVIVNIVLMVFGMIILGIFGTRMVADTSMDFIEDQMIGLLDLLRV